MSTLLTRPTTGSARPGEPVGRPVAVAAALAGLASAVIGLVVCASVALTGWFLADAGAHGDTLDALRVGADAWLAGHGSGLVVSGVPLGVTPLVVTMVVALTAFRGGRWASRHAAAAEDDRSLGGAVAAFAGAYVVVAVVTCVAASTPGAQPALGGTLLGALVVSAVAGGCGLVAGSGRLQTWSGQAPQWATDVVVGAVGGVLWLLAAGAVLAGVALLLSFNEAATVMSQLHLSVGDALSFTVVMALFAPNAALFGVSYLVGPGFAFGTGTAVSPTAVSLGVVPAFPMLAALPGDGAPPGWMVLLLAVPVLAASLGIGLTLRRHDPIAHDLAAVRGAGAGFCAGLLVTVLIALAGGPLGTGRMADVGAPVSEVLVFASGLMGVGGLVGAVVANGWRRRRGVPTGPDEPGGDLGGDAGSEPTVEVLR
jgi:Family of unknown function (DUF6350)